MATSSVSDINSASSSSPRDVFNDPTVQELFTTNKIDVKPVISFHISQDILAFKKQLLVGLNENLFNLKVSAERLTDSSFLSSLHFLSVVSSDSLAIRASAEDINSGDFQSKLASASAADITGNASAGEYTALTGVFGYLLIEGQRIPIGTNPHETKTNRGYPDTLIEIKNRINSLPIESQADIVNGKLVIFSPAGRAVSVGDFTSGGKTNGLQLVAVPQRDASDILGGFVSSVNPRVDTTFASVQKIRSFTAVDMSNNPLANANTPLYGISGNVTINGIPVAFDTAGVADSLQLFANRINSISSSLGASASVDGNNRLVIVSTDYTKPLSVQDATTGGFAGGPGGLGLSRSANSGSKDTAAASAIGLYDVTVIGTAQRQKNVSYSAAEITGNSSATAATPLGLTGNLVINGTKVYLFSYENLNDMASVLNGMGAGVTASVVENKLVLESSSANSVGFTLTDNSSGGTRGGLGIGVLSRDAKSVPLQVFTGNISANLNTFLAGISGYLQFKNSNTTLTAVINPTTITVASASGLQAGDVLTLNPGGAAQEEKQIVSISGTTITLDAAMNFAHAAGEAATNVRTIQVGLQGTTDTAQRLVDAINNKRGAGVTASIDANNRLVFSSTQPAITPITDATTGGNAGTQGAFGLLLFQSQAVQAQNAVYQVNGVTYSQPTNTVTDGVPGVRFQLQSGSFPGSSNIMISTEVTEQDNVANIEDMIKNFAVKFNDSLKTLNKLTQFNTHSEDEGAFYRNAGLETFKNTLVSSVTTPVTIANNTEISLQDIGARLDEKLNGILNSTLSLDEDKLHKEITQNLKSVVALFNSQYNGIGERVSSLLNALILGDGIPKVDMRLEDKFTLFKQLEQQVLFSFFGSQQKGQVVSQQA